MQSSFNGEGDLKNISNYLGIYDKELKIADGLNRIVKSIVRGRVQSCSIKGGGGVLAPTFSRGSFLFDNLI